MWIGWSSLSAWTASRRSPSTWKSRSHISAFSTMWARTAGSSRFTLKPHVLRLGVAEVGAELGEVVPARSEVVVDDVLHDREPRRVRGVDEALIGRRPAVRLMHGVPEDAVVAPVPLAVEAVDRKQLDVRHAELDQVVEPADRGIQRPLRGEGADVELVDQPAGELAAGPRVVGPGERARGRNAPTARARRAADAATAGRAGRASASPRTKPYSSPSASARSARHQPSRRRARARHPLPRRRAAAARCRPTGPRPRSWFLLGREQCHWVVRRAARRGAGSDPVKRRPVRTSTEAPGVTQQHGVAPAPAPCETDRQPRGDRERAAAIERDRVIGCLADDGHRRVPRVELRPVAAQPESARSHEQLGRPRLVDGGQLARRRIPHRDRRGAHSAPRSRPGGGCRGRRARSVPELGALVDVRHARPRELQQLRAQRVGPAERRGSRARSR